MPAPGNRQTDPVSDRYYYPHAPKQTRRRLVTETYEYDAPFKYDNIRVQRSDMMAREAHGVEMNAVNIHHPPDAPEPHDLEADSITIAEERPMVRVTVIGSACTPPGYVQLECVPIEAWRNRDEMPGALAPRFRANGLWGMHLRVDALMAEAAPVQPAFNRVDAAAYEDLPEAYYDLFPSARGRLHLKAHYRENPLAGMSCAVFEIPPSRQVVIHGGSETPGWASDNFPGDHHYSFRTVRTTVLTSSEGAA